MSKAVLRQIGLGLLALGLVATATLLQLDNSALAKSIEAKAHQNPKPSTEDPVVEDPVVTPIEIQAIKAKLAGDGCNLNADLTATKHVLGTCKFLLIGDSLGNNLAYGMITQVANQSGLTFTRTAKASTGLSNPWFYNWHTNLATFLKTYKPNLVIVFLGANDRQNYVINGVTQTFGTESWKRTYRTNIEKLAGAATKSGAYVLWVGMPIMKPYNYAKGITQIDEQFAISVPKVPGAIYLPTRAFTADKLGNYRQSGLVNGKNRIFRGDDGIHFSSVGQQVIATYVINTIARTYHVSIPPKNPAYLTK